MQREAKKLGLGMWNLYAAIYAGTPEQLQANWNILLAAFKASGGVVQLEEDMDENARALFQRPKSLMQGGLTLDEFSMYNYRGGGGSMWFAPVAPARGEEAIRQTAMARDILAKYSFDYICGWVVGWRELHHIIDLLYDRSNPAEMKKAYACFDELVSTFAQKGYGIYRTNIAFMDKVAQTFGPVQREVNRRIKRALDPNGILAPGKSGIHL
jgi:4-cresol dehydrogenase (hydroxylating)